MAASVPVAEAPLDQSLPHLRASEAWERARAAPSGGGALECARARERRRGASRNGGRLAALPEGAAGRARAGAGEDAGAGTGLTAVGLDW